jgi:hypothetical protein
MYNVNKPIQLYLRDRDTLKLRSRDRVCQTSTASSCILSFLDLCLNFLIGGLKAFSDDSAVRGLRTLRSCNIIAAILLFPLFVASLPPLSGDSETRPLAALRRCNIIAATPEIPQENSNAVTARAKLPTYNQPCTSISSTGDVALRQTLATVTLATVHARKKKKAASGEIRKSAPRK